MRIINPHFKDIPHIQSIVDELKNLKKNVKKGLNHDLNDSKIYKLHADLIVDIGEIYLNREGRSFDIDSENSNVLKFLIYYFNNCKKAENVFPDENYKIHKNIILAGTPGTGKTILMQIFSEYLRIVKNNLFFHNLSVTQMLNYYKLNSHIDRFTFNEYESNNFNGSPFHVCLNDIGINQKQNHFGTDVRKVVDEFLFARYEIYERQRIRYHLTTNLSVDDFKNEFENRLYDRFNSFNILLLKGESRRK